jgi:predicted nucleic acid-binding protein
MIYVRCTNFDFNPPREEIWQAQVIIAQNQCVYAKTFDKSRSALVFIAQDEKDAHNVAINMTLNNSIWNRYGDDKTEGTK